MSISIETSSAATGTSTSKLNEFSRLVGDGSSDDIKKRTKKPFTKCNGFTLAIVLIAICVIVKLLWAIIASSSNKLDFDKDEGVAISFKSPLPKKRKCMFCDRNKSPPILHEDRGYTVDVPSYIVGGEESKTAATATTSAAAAVVTPMTFTYNYELRDGQLLFTDPRSEIIPNLPFDYAVLELTSVRNINVETNEDVSLDEVYLHHLTFQPVGMIGAEALTATPKRYPPGFAFHVVSEENPYIVMNAHLLSNKNLEPIDGSIELARKQCNECYYAPGKGKECTPERTGTFECCGDSESCTSPNTADCACATTTLNESDDATRTTQYRIEVEMLISKDIDKFRRIDTWTLAAPKCVVNLMGQPIFEPYAPNNFCYNNSYAVFRGDNSLFHHIEEQPVNDPYVKTSVSAIAPTSGLIVGATSHLHTGAVNSTLYVNGEVLCSAYAKYGNNSDPSTNAMNEQNHLIHISDCYDFPFSQQGGYKFHAGDVLSMESVYNGSPNDDRFVGYGAAGEHLNVMSFFGMKVVFDGTAPFVAMKRTSFSAYGDLEHALNLKPLH